jgi:hypothetical protein
MPDHPVGGWGGFSHPMALGGCPPTLHGQIYKIIKIIIIFLKKIV